MTTSPPSTSTLTPPPLPISLVTTLLPHLLPPSPLPQELLCRSLLQRLLYLPPSASDLDSFLSPFPSSESQPISSRLQELSHGHGLGEAQYTKEGDEVYAKIPILPEHDSEQGDESIEIWFEFESSITSPSESRGWVYHSSRIPLPPSQTTHQFVSTPSLLSTLSQEEEEVPFNTEQDGDNTQAPEGYWTAFDSPPSTNSTSLPQTDHETDQNHEDAYWAQYSRPATAPITPGIHTPFHPKVKSPLGGEVNNQEEQARKLTESLNQLGLGQLNNEMNNGYSKIGGDGKRGFWEDAKHDEEFVENTQEEVMGKAEGVEVEESGAQVKDKLRCKISISLNKIWKSHINGINELDLEIKAMEWLNFGKSVIENQPSNNEDNEKIYDKLEILWEMYQLLNETDQEKDNFFRLLESVIKKSPDYRNEDDFDEVQRQNNYYE